MSSKKYVGLGIWLLFAWVACDDPDIENNNTNNVNNINNINNTSNINNININNINNTNNITIIPASQNKTEAQALSQLFPGATSDVATSASGNYYVLRNGTQEIVGYGLVNSHYGFNGEVTTMVGISTAGLNVGLETINQRESWWSMLYESFFTQFKGIAMDSVTLLPEYDPNCYRCTSIYDAIGVDAVSGATYTSDAVVKNAMAGFLHWDELLSFQNK